MGLVNNPLKSLFYDLYSIFNRFGTVIKFRNLQMKYIFTTFFIVIGFLLSSQDKFIPTELVLERVSGFSANDRIEDILIQKDMIFIAGKTGIKSYDNKSFILKNENNESNAIAVKVSRKGVIYSAHQNRKIYKNRQVFFSLKNKNDKFTDIALFKNKLWVGTTNGIYILHAESGKQIDYFNSLNSNLSSDYIRFVFYSKSHDNIWIGTDEGVIEVKGEKNWKLDYKREKFIAATENKEGLWLLTDQELYLIKNGREHPQGLRKGLYMGEVNDLALDNRNNLYVASDILTRYNPYRNQLEQYGKNLGLVSSKCLSLASDKKGALWLGTADAGLFRIYTDSIKIEDMRITIIPENTISCFGKRDASLKIEVYGGQEPYNFYWSPVNLMGQNPTNLKSGVYSVTVEDNLGSRKFTSVRIDDPDQLVNNILETRAVSRAGKKDGYAQIDISGGTSPYEILWDTEEKGDVSKKLNYGFNFLTITDSNGCSIVETVNIDKPKILPDLDITKIKVGQTLQLNKLYFQADSSAITSESFEVMEEVYEFMDENKNVVIEIGGHTNNIPRDDYCDRLSSSRARTVAEFLHERGIDVERIAYKGYGKHNPIATNETRAGRKKNQRVEIKILRVNL